jgi:ABC-type Zn uptake system ZnuABC Zn-binding protein ZnuA
MVSSHLPLLCLAFTCWCASVVRAQEPHAVCATTPDLAALCRAVGADHVEVTCFVKGPEDPHFLEARPSMVRAASKAAALVEVGRDFEIGWLPLLVDNSRNGAIQAGQPGRIVAGDAVRKLVVPTGPVDRSLGDVHAGGNPHFLADPLCGLQVAQLLRDRFTALWPTEQVAFATNFTAFRDRLAVAMVGAEVAKRYGHDAEKFATLFPSGKLEAVLEKQGDLGELGGWFGAWRKLRGGAVVADHDLWPYFAERFGIEVIGFFEPKPGVAPTTAHLTELIGRMRARDVHAILSASYFDPKHAELVARTTGASIAAMAHQPGAQVATDDYLAFVDYNVRTLAGALQAPTLEKK